MPRYLALLLSSFSICAASAQLNISTAMTPAELVQDALLGQGVTAFNVTFNGVPDPPTPQVGTGSFEVVSSNLGLASGVILSTCGSAGIAQAAVNGPIDPGSGFSGDADLMAAALASDPDAFAVNDYAILEFDFIPTGDSLKFSFVFGSEEYPEFVCAYNDVFGFFLSGPGINGPYSNNAENIALVPGTTQAITINNVNNGLNNNPNDFACPAVNPAYYIDNSGGTTVVFDGMTVVIQALAQVICGETYHIKLAIADVNDAGVDSGVFLEAGSFTSTGQIVPSLSIAGVSANDTTMFEGCGLIPFEFFRLGDTSNVDTVDIVIGGTATGGVDYVPGFPTQLIYQAGDTVIPFPLMVPLDADGLETITIQITQNIVCSGTQVVNDYVFYIDSYDPLDVVTTDIAGDCGGQYNLIPVVTGGTGLYQFDWSTGAVTPTIQVAPGVTTTYLFTVSDTCGVQSWTDSIVVDIPVYAPLDLEVSPTTLINCLETDPIGVVSITGGDGDYDYAWTNEGDNAGSTATITVPSASPATTYIVTVTDGCGEQITDSVEVGTVPLDPIVIEAPDMTPICAGDTLTLEVTGVTGGNGVYTYAWTNSADQVLSLRDTLQVGVPVDAVYTITVEDQCGTVGSTTVNALIPHPEPFVLTFNPDTTICLNDSLELWARVSGGSGYYTIAWEGYALNDPKMIVSPPSNESYTVLITDQCGEVIADQVNIGVEAPQVNIHAVNRGQDDWTFEAATLPTFCRSYRWDLGDGTLSRERTVAHSYLNLEEHWVKLKVITYVGCPAEDSVLIRPPGQLWFPNAFTPDGDGINETFGPAGRYVTSFEMAIYDRWGQPVFATADVTIPWDGLINGAQAPTGVYVFKYKAEGHLFPSQEGFGHVTLLRGSEEE